MPLVEIDVIAGRPAERTRAIADAVHTAMCETIGIPQRDRFQLINERQRHQLIYDPGYLDIRRTDDIVIIRIVLAAGRTVEQKQRLYARIAELLVQNADVRREDVTICLIENERDGWSFGRGEASYVVLPREQWR